MSHEWWTNGTAQSQLKQVSLDEACSIIASAPPHRNITEVIIHHTWSPTAEQYNGLSTWKGIQSYHVVTRGWSDIGYHIGVAPDDSVWLLRPLPRSGGHCLGHNGSSIGVVMLGNYDTGADDPRAITESTARVVRALVSRYELTTADVRFHREFADKTCPGTNVDLGVFRAMVKSASTETGNVWRFASHRDGPDILATGIATTWDDHVTRTGVAADASGLVACSLPRGLCEKTKGSPFTGVPDFTLVRVWNGATNETIVCPVIDEGPANEAQGGTGERGNVAIDLTTQAHRDLGNTPNTNITVTLRVIHGSEAFGEAWLRQGGFLK